MLRSHIKESWWGAKGTVGHLWEGGIQRHRQGKKQTITLRGGGEAHMGKTNQNIWL